MKVFHCPECHHLAFFESTRCEHCGHGLAYAPHRRSMVLLDAVPPEQGGDERPVRACANGETYGVCNWALEPDEEGPLCLSCRLTQVVPPLGDATAREQWGRAEAAKRRLLVNLMCLGLSIDDPERPQNELRFELLQGQAGHPVLTGHRDGVITLNVSEADDVERERLRSLFEEPYRTVLGHLRHEAGHFYWERLVRGTNRLEAFRSRFGDETGDYGEALAQHYAAGARADWHENFISAYASVHPWEDWAETFAHYLHMTDTLETARCCGLTLRPRHHDEPVLAAPPLGEDMMHASFDSLVRSWTPVTYLLNNLNRGLGLRDAYPFHLTPPVIEKLRFVHDSVHSARRPSALRHAA